MGTLRRTTTATALLPAAGCLLVALVALATVVAVARTGGPPSPDDADRRTVAALLDRVTVVDRRVRVLGYDRDQFGGWTSGVTADGGYCTSREAVLVTTFGRHPGSAGPPACPDPGPTAVDVYTGRRISPGEVQIDHVVPLAAAWDHGAHAWPRDRRVDFANDLALNLVAVAGPVNQAKSDGTPGEWLPPGDGAVPCAYIARSLTVSDRYGLTVIDADAAASRRTSRL
jgi:hypothetical protein